MRTAPPVRRDFRSNVNAATIWGGEPIPLAIYDHHVVSARITKHRVAALRADTFDAKQPLAAHVFFEIFKIAEFFKNRLAKRF